jgi:hypothetical protein
VNQGSAQALAEELEQTYNSPGFKFLMDRFRDEMRKFEENVIQTGQNPRSSMNPSQVAMALRYHQGVLYGVKAFEGFTLSLLKELKSGRVPGGRNRGPQVYDER